MNKNFLKNQKKANNTPQNNEVVENDKNISEINKNETKTEIKNEIENNINSEVNNLLNAETIEETEDNSTNEIPNEINIEELANMSLPSLSSNEEVNESNNLNPLPNLNEVEDTNDANDDTPENTSVEELSLPSIEEKEEIKEPETKVETLPEIKTKNINKQISEEKIRNSVSNEEAGEFVDQALEIEFIIKSGSYYEIQHGLYEGKRIRGLSQLINFISINDEIIDEINEYKNLKEANIDESSSEVQIEDLDESSDNTQDTSNNSTVESEVEENSETSGLQISEEVLKYVCVQTVKNLRDNFKSEIYSESYATSLFEKYINGETDSSNPLFKELISECINNNFEDPYLQDLSLKVLGYIKES